MHRLAALHVGAKQSTIAVATIFIVILLSILLWHDRFFAVSIDIAAHYQVVFCIEKSWSWPHLETPCFGIMGAYPPLTHMLAIFTGLFAGSPFIGMHVLTVLSLTASYFVLTYSMPRLLPPLFLLVLVLLLALFAAFRTSSALYGFEIIGGNYFFAQLVSNAAFLIILLLFCRSKLSIARWPLLAILSVWIMGSAYSLSALHLALGLEACAIIRVTRAALSAKRVDRRSVLGLSLLALLLGAAVVLHPTFEFMIQGARHDGGLNLAFGENWLLPLSVALAAAALMIAWEYCRNRTGTGSLFLASADLAIAVAAVAQIASFRILEMGSHYAVKKHAFGLVTLLIVSIVHLSILYALRLARTSKNLRQSEASGDNLTVISVGAFSVLVLIVVFPEDPSLSVSSFIQIQQAARQIVHDHAPVDAVGHSISLQGNLPEALNGVISATEFEFPFSPALHYVYDFSRIFLKSEVERVPPKYAFVSGDAHGHGTECNLSHNDSTPGLRLVKYGCLISTPPYRPGQRLTGGDAEWPFMRSGWSVKEPWGSWTNGREAILAFRLPGSAQLDLVLEADAFAFVTPAHSQTVEIVANGTKVGEWFFSATSPQVIHPLIIPAEAFRQSDTLLISFRLPDAISPHELGISEDRRVLGLGLRSILLKSRSDPRP